MSFFPVSEPPQPSEDEIATDLSASHPTRRRVLAGLSGLATLGSIAGCGGRGNPTDGSADTTTNGGADTTTDGTVDLGPVPEPVGPWPQARADAGNTGFVSAVGPTDSPSLRWSVTAAGTVGTAVGQVVGTVSSGSGVIVAARDGRVAAFDSDGTQRWETELSGAELPPTVGSDRVVVSTGEELIVLDVDTGDRLRSIDQPSYDTLTIAGDRVLVGTLSDGVVAVDLDSGSEVWRSRAPDRATLSVTAEGIAYVTARRLSDENQPGAIVALDLETGDIEWEVDLNAERVGLAVRDGTVYVGTGGLDRSGIYALDAASGDRQWHETFEGRMTGGPTVAADGIYVMVLKEGPVKLGFDGEVKWRSGADGEVKWRSGVSYGGTAPVLTDDLVLVKSDEGVVAVERTDGGTRWQAQTDALVPYGIRVVDGQVYAGDRYGALSAFDVDSGDPTWRIGFQPTRMPGPVVGPRTIAGGSRRGGTYNLLATEGQELPVAGGSRNQGVTPAVLNDRDLSTDGAGETLLGGGVDGSLFRVRTIESGSRPSGDITPTPTPAPDEPTATVTPAVNFERTQPAWTATLDTEIRSAVTYADGSAYVGTPEGIVAVDPRDGSVRVRVPLGESVDGAPAVGDDRVFAVTPAGRLVAIAADADTYGTDRIDWETTLDAGSRSGPTVVDGTVFVAGDDGRIVAYTIDGDRLWDQPLEAEIVGGTAVTDTHVVVGTEASEVVALDRDEGSIAWRAETRGPIRGTPAVAGTENVRTVYAGDRDGTLSAFAASDGTVRFRYEVGRYLDAPPAVGHGTVFIADQTRRVYAVVGD